MTLGLTSSGAVKIKTDGGLRAVNCACCGCDLTIETAKTTTISLAYNFDISTPSWSGQFTVPIEETGYPLLNYKKFCDNDTPQDFLGPCSEDADYINYKVAVSKFLTPIEEIPCLIDDFPETVWGGTWISFDCEYSLAIAKDPNNPSFFALDAAIIVENVINVDPNDCFNQTYSANWSYQLRPCSFQDPSAGGLTAKQVYQGLFEGGDVWTPWTPLTP
jgi:hypothetical protein